MVSLPILAGVVSSSVVRESVMYMQETRDRENKMQKLIKDDLNITNLKSMKINKKNQCRVHKMHHSSSDLQDSSTFLSSALCGFNILKYTALQFIKY
jgi:hypothetical protein